MTKSAGGYPGHPRMLGWDCRRFSLIFDKNQYTPKRLLPYSLSTQIIMATPHCANKNQSRLLY
ncbi:hypothetical protein [Nostoc sp.]|uniref:hypothetical protein n=1 Tax=Nostoc sp. TaxID=1180 RepID=UPI002FF5E054